MQTRFKAYDRLGAERGTIPHVLEGVWTPPLNELPTLELHFAVNAIRSDYLNNDPEVAYEWYDEATGEWIEPFNARFRFISDDFDHLEEVPTKKYTFIGVGESLRGQSVYASYGKPTSDEGKVQFKKTNAGAILKEIWDRAVSRGWKGFSYSFNDTVDSAGQPWNHEFNISYSPENKLQSILEALHRQGNLDYAWEGRTLHAYRSNGFMARDKTLGVDPLKFALSGGPTGTDGAPESTDHENLATHVIVLGEEDLRWEFPTGAILPEGRREVYLTYSGVDDIGTARILADPVIVKSVNPLINTTRQFHLRPDTKFLPLRDYRVGDWALIERNGQWERLRIISLTLWTNQNGVHGYVTLGDKIDDVLEKMYQRIQGLQGGAANELPAKPPVPKDRTPRAPEALIAISNSFIDQSTGVTQGIIAANWTHTSLDTRGDPIAVDEYVAEYRETNEELYRGWMPLFTIDHPTMSGSASPIVVFDSRGQPKTYTVRVRAVSQRGITSDWSNLSTVTMVRDLTPPPVPTVPTVQTSGPLFLPEWDGLGQPNVKMPPDFSHVNVWMSDAEDGQYEIVGQLLGEGSTPVWQKGYVSRWFRLQAEDIAGNRSTLTTPAIRAQTMSIINETVFNDRFNQINSDIEKATSSSNGKITISPDAPDIASLAGKMANAMWIRVVGGKQVGAWFKATDTAQVWTPMPLSETLIPQINIGTGTFGELDGVRMKLGSLSVKHLAVMDPTNYFSGGNFDQQAELDAHWVSTATTAVIHRIVAPSVMVPQSGSGCLQILGAPSIRMLNYGTPIAVKAGDKFRIELSLKRDDLVVNYTANTKIRIGNQDDVPVFNKYLTNIPTEWESRFWEFTIPEGTSALNLSLWTDHKAGYLYYDNFRMRSMETGELLVDGAIKARAIDTQELAADTAFISYLEAKLIVSDVFKGKTFEGVTFIGSIFKTQPEYARGVQWNSSGIKAFTTEGIRTFFLDAANGDFTANQGTLTGMRFQTSSIGNRGIKMDETGFYQWSDTGRTLVRLGGGVENLIVGELRTDIPGNSGIRLSNFNSYGWPGISFIREGYALDYGSSIFGRYTVASPRVLPELVLKAPNERIVGGSVSQLGLVRVEGDLRLSLGDREVYQLRAEQPFQIFAQANDGSYHSMLLRSKLMTLEATDGNIVLNAGNQYVQMPSSYWKTTGLAGNVVMAADGGIFRSTSSKKYKDDIQPLELDPRLLDVGVVDWIDKFAQQEEKRLTNEFGPLRRVDAERLENIQQVELQRIPGAIAEEVEAAGGSSFITYSPDGEVEALMYDRFTLARTELLKIEVRNLNDRVEALTRQLEQKKLI